MNGQGGQIFLSATGQGWLILSMSGQGWLFLSTVLVGAAIGLLYDAFRIFRKTAPHSSFAVQLEDLFFWVAATGLTFYYMLHRNYGEIRPFALLGFVVGVLLYFATLSRVVMVVFVAVINYLKRVIAAAVRIILIPVRLVASLLAPYMTRAYGATRKQARKVKRYGKNKLRKTARDWVILRKKV